MAAGNWYTGAGLGDANIAVGPRTLEVALNSASKNQEIVGHPVIQAMLAADLAMGDMAGFLGISPSLAAIGQGKMATSAEGNEASATNFSTSNATTLTPGRREFARNVGDFAVSVQRSMLRGELAPDEEALLALEGYNTWSNDLIDRIVALASSASNTVGTTATALTWQAMHHGVLGFKDRGAGRDRKLALIDLKGAKDLADDALSLGGAVANSAQVQQFLNNGAAGSYIGTFFGMLDVHLCGELDTDSGDTLGILLGPGGVHSKHQRVALPPNADELTDTGLYTIELLRQSGGYNRVQMVSHNAVGIREQGRMAAIRYVS